MPQGYYTIEQWVKGEWVVVRCLPFGVSLTEAEGEIERMGRAGFYRVVQMQRVIWAEKEGGKLRLRKSHAGSPGSLEGMAEMFERNGGKYPVEEVRAARKRMKEKRS